MKRCNAKKVPRIRTKLIIFVTSFLALGLLLLLFFQTFFTDDLYAFVKTRTVESIAKDIAQQFEQEDLQELASYYTLREGCEVYIVDNNGNTLYSHGIIGGRTELLIKGQLRAYYDMAKASKSGMVSTRQEVNFKDSFDSIKPPLPKGDSPGGDRQPPMDAFGVARHGEKSGEQVICACLVETTSTEEPPLVLVSSVLTPVNATVRVVQVQLIIAMILMVGVAAVLTWFMSKIIAQPIVDINEAAKGLSTRTYQPPQEGSYREVAELRQTLTVINSDLRKSEQLQRDLIANVSHDLRTPLTMIIGYGEAIRDLPGENSPENIQVVIDEAERLSSLVNDVLDLSKLQSGAQTFDMAPVNLTELVEQVVDRCRRMTQCAGYDIVWSAQEDAMVSGDVVRLSQVIYNLLINAMVHTGEDKCVNVTQTVFESTVRVVFTDSGKGIPPQELSNIWQRYYQVHSHEKRSKAMNSGLGLSIVRSLVGYHGGCCGVESELGKGSSFWFELPRI